VSTRTLCGKGHQLPLAERVVRGLNTAAQALIQDPDADRVREGAMATQEFTCWSTGYQPQDQPLARTLGELCEQLWALARVIEVYGPTSPATRTVRASALWQMTEAETLLLERAGQQRRAA